MTAPPETDGAAVRDDCRARVSSQYHNAVRVECDQSTAYRSASLAGLCDIAEALGVTITERTELRDPNAA